MIRMTITSSHRNFYNQHCIEAEVSLDEMCEYMISMDREGTSVQLRQAKPQRVEFSIFDSHTSTWSELVCEGSEADMIDVVIMMSLCHGTESSEFVTEMIRPIPSEDLVYVNIPHQRCLTPMQW